MERLEVLFLSIHIQYYSIVFLSNAVNYDPTNDAGQHQTVLWIK